MIFTKIVLSVFAVVKVSSAEPLSSEHEKVYREGVKSYTEESNDYLRTLQETQDELVAWRQKIIHSRFVDKLLSVEKVLSKSNSEVIGEIEGYVKRNGPDSLDDTLLMRMAQLHYDRANFDFNKKMEGYERLLSEYQRGSRKNLPDLPVPQYAKTIFYSQKLIKRFPDSPLNDWARYLLGYCLFDQGDFEKAALIYAKLVRLYPYSTLAPEVRWRLGEYYFDDMKYRRALRQYRAIVKTKNPFSKKAKYKLGATQYVLKNYKKASTIFVELMRDMELELGSADPEVQTLYDEAVDYLAHLRASGQRTRLTDSEDGLISERLAQAYRRIQREADSRNAYLDYVKRRSTGMFSPRYMDQVISSFESDDKNKKAQSVRDRFARALGPESIYWKRQKDVSALIEAQDLYEKNLLASADYYGAKARKTKKQKDFLRAANYYKRFITEFSVSPLKARASYELADLYFTFKRYKLAKMAFTDVVNDPSAGGLQTEAAYGRLLAHSKVIGFDLKGKGAKPLFTKDGRLSEPTPLNKVEKSFVGEVGRYLKVVTKGARRQKVLYRAASVFFNHNHFDKSRQSLEMILDEKNPTLVSRNALYLIKRSYDAENNWSQLVSSERRLRSLGQNFEPDGFLEALDLDPGISDGFGELEKAYEKEQLGRFASAADIFEQFTVAYPRSPEAGRALYRAGINYKKAALISNSNKVFDRLLSSYPKSRFRVAARYYRAENEVDLLNFQEAVVKFRQFRKKYPSHPLSVQALYNEATLTRDLKKPLQAANLLVAYAKKTGEYGMWFEAAKLYVDAGKTKRAIKLYSLLSRGRYGREHVVKALMSRAMLGATAGGPKVFLSQALEDCRAIKAIVKKYSLSMTANNTNGVKACNYVAVWPIRDRIHQLLKSPSPSEEGAAKEIEKVKESMAVLEKKMAKIEKAGVDHWKVPSYYDLGELLILLSRRYQNLDSMTSKEYEGRAFEIFERTLKLALANQELRPWIVKTSRYLHQIQPDKKVLVDAKQLWKVFDVAPESIEVPLASDSPLSVAFNQSDWEKVETLAKKELEETKDYGFYLAWSRSLAERYLWADAREILLKCIEELNDPSCGAALLLTQGKTKQSRAVAGLVKRGLKSAARKSYLRIGLASYAMAENRPKVALKFAMAALKDNDQSLNAYRLVASILSSETKYGLSNRALNRGLQLFPTSQSLRVQKGYVSLGLRLYSDAEKIMEDLLQEEVSSPQSVGFVSDFWLANDDPNQAKMAIQNSKGSSIGFKATQFSYFLQTGNLEKTQELLPSVEENCRHSGRSCFLAGIYFGTVRSSREVAQDYFKRASANGVWSGVLKQNAMAFDDRLPAQEQGGVEQ